MTSRSVEVKRDAPITSSRSDAVSDRKAAKKNKSRQRDQQQELELELELERIRQDYIKYDHNITLSANSDTLYRLFGTQRFYLKNQNFTGNDFKDFASFNSKLFLPSAWIKHL